MVDYNTTQQHTREHIDATFRMFDTSASRFTSNYNTMLGALEHYADGECFGLPDHSSRAFNMGDDYNEHDASDEGCEGFASHIEFCPHVNVATFVMRDTRDDIDNDPSLAPSTDECEGRTRTP